MSNQFRINIDKLTRSIENTISGDSFRTEVLPVSVKDMKNLRAKDWVFDWKNEFGMATKSIYKLVIADNPTIIQGLISIEDRADHFFMHP